ncbi:MAG: metal-dependent hydrolase [Gemmatimonadales bacterium]
MPSLIFHGHACFELVHGSNRVLIDPFLSGNPLADVGPDEIMGIDAILLTHGHGDHLGDTVRIAKQNEATVVAPYELANYCQSQGCKVHPMHIGGGHDFAFGHVKMVVAFHGGGCDGEGGTGFATFPCGYVVTLGGVRIYHTGDTALTLEMQLLRDRVDVMLVPIGDNFTMGIEDAVRALEFVRPKVAVPMHWNTFDLIKVNVGEFADAAQKVCAVVVLQPGESHDA